MRLAVTFYERLSSYPFSIMKESLSFRTQECVDQNCRFRFPVMEGKTAISSCPKCGAAFNGDSISYGRHYVERGDISSSSFEMHVLLDNIRSLYNVGSVFRTAVGVGIKKLHLCGMTATPENPRLAKTALGAEKSLPWAYYNNALLAGKGLIEEGYSLWAVEGGEGAVSLFDAKPPEANERIVLIIGNELAGIDPELLKICEKIVYIPMQGGKESLNLTGAFGIAAYFLRNLNYA